MTHTLKCHAENFDAIVGGLKRFEVRHEDDRTFTTGDVLQLVRTDVDGRPTKPHQWCEVAVLFLSRMAGPLSILGVDPEAERKTLPLVVMSISGRRS